MLRSAICFISFLTLVLPAGLWAQNLLDEPESVVFDSLHHRYLVSNWGDGNIIQVAEDGTQDYFYTELGGSVAGLYIAGNILFAAANYSPEAHLVGIDLSTQTVVKDIFITGAALLNGITSDTSGFVYVTDYEADKIYKIRLSDDSYTTFVNSGFLMPNGIEFDAHNNRLLVVDDQLAGNPIIAVSLEDSSLTQLVTLGTPPDGLTKDEFGYYYVSSWQTSTIYAYDTTFTNPPEVVSTGYPGPADICYSPYNNTLAIPCFNGDRLELINVHMDIASDTTWGFAPLDVNFSGSSRLDVDEWIWDFGDGDSGSGQSPTHTYQEHGMFDVTLKIAVDSDTLSWTEDDYVIVLADTLVSGDAQGDPGGTVEVVLRARNTVPLNKLRIPVEYSGILGLTLDSVSAAGCRTENFDHVDTVSYEPVQRRIYIRVSNDYGSSTPDLEPGDGSVLKLYFTISPSAPHGYPNSIGLDGYSSNVPKFEGPYVAFVPANLAGAVSLVGTCGDANSDEVVNILDVTFIVNYLYKNGPDPVNPDLVDVNGDDAMNILDVTYIVNYLYKNGPDPSCQ